MLARFVNSLPTGLSQRITKLYFQVLVRNQRELHSSVEYHQYSNMDVKILPALKDNYMYLLVDKATNEAAVVDPVETKTVLQAVHDHQLKLTTVLTTHHHWDHAGGNEELANQVPGIEVYGGDDRIGALTKKVEHNTIFNIGNLMVQCLFTPCHTMGHICYYVTTPGEGSEGVVFTGDTLFLAGCGRFFEGNAEQMYNAFSILGSLPDNTKVYCGHEYTLQNLKFALHVEPSNNEILKKIAWSELRREEGKPTVPSTIGEEKSYNPFMRVYEAEVMQHANAQNAIQAMKNIRLEKDSFQ
ncbi:unnamed protein product [Spodoptera littoralis]|uniref:hydroxyacylglutathione hydrolase n=1 Tax=Spodoptera littoralis TaxID=7109 RepID=A0A9P0ID28_SPOLI|nr:unnamed protein product [Spodoptera littoralis]CAH1645370.1 unnamed protein product [Spodoptera littoralis]